MHNSIEKIDDLMGKFGYTIVSNGYHQRVDQYNLLVVFDGQVVDHITINGVKLYPKPDNLNQVPIKLLPVVMPVLANYSSFIGPGKPVHMITQKCATCGVITPDFIQTKLGAYCVVH